MKERLWGRSWLTVEQESQHRGKVWKPKEAQNSPQRKVPGVPGLGDPTEVTAGRKAVGWVPPTVWSTGWMAGDTLNGNYRGAGVPQCVCHRSTRVF